MRDVIGIRYFRSTLGGCTAQITVIFRVKVRVRIRFRVRVLGNSDHCVLKFNCVPRYKKIPMTSCTGFLISMFGTRMCGQTLLFIHAEHVVHSAWILF